MKFFTFPGLTSLTSLTSHFGLTSPTCHFGLTSLTFGLPSSAAALLTTILLFLLPLCLHAEGEESFRILSYNVENLFDYEHDSLKQDSAFLPDGLNHWTESRYRTKLHHLSQVIATAGGWQAPAVVGLMEVENSRCLEDLCRFYLPHSRFPYRILHFESPDVRGVDVAMLYDTLRLRLLDGRPVPVVLPQNERPTRDLLYAKMELLQTHDTLHLVVCHFPSQLGGASATAHKREAAFSALAHITDSLLSLLPEAKIIAMGDFNTSPSSRMAPMQNLMLNTAAYILEKPANIDGTHKYQGDWSFLDQFIVSPFLVTHAACHPNSPSHSLHFGVYAPEWLVEKDEKFLGTKPKRTFSGPRYLCGYSDHLPIYIDLPLAF